MKKSFFRLILAVVLLINIAFSVVAQQPKATKDTINADKAAKPVFYQAAEEEGTSSCCSGSTMYIIGGIVVVAGVAGYLFLKKKKK